LFSLVLTPVKSRWTIPLIVFIVREIAARFAFLLFRETALNRFVKNPSGNYDGMDHKNFGALALNMQNMADPKFNNDISLSV
jgi:hypothetical protein